MTFVFCRPKTLYMFNKKKKDPGVYFTPLLIRLFFILEA